MRRRVRLAALAALAAALTVAVPAGSAPLAPARADPRALVLRDPAVSAVNRRLARGERPGVGVDRDRVLLADLTRDGRLDAVVPIAGGGLSGVVAFFVYAVVDGKLRDILPVNDTDRAELAIERGRLVAVTPVYRARDPRCCPSALETTVLRWDGQQMAVLSRRRAPAPAR